MLAAFETFLRSNCAQIASLLAQGLGLQAHTMPSRELQPVWKLGAGTCPSSAWGKPVPQF